MMYRLLDLDVVDEAYHKIQIVSCASAKLHLIMELVYRLRKILRFSETGGVWRSRITLTFLYICLW